MKTAKVAFHSSLSIIVVVVFAVCILLGSSLVDDSVKCIAKSRSRRYATGRELSAELCNPLLAQAAHECHSFGRR